MPHDTNTPSSLTSLEMTTVVQGGEGTWLISSKQDMFSSSPNYWWHFNYWIQFEMCVSVFALCHNRVKVCTAGHTGDHDSLHCIMCVGQKLFWIPATNPRRPELHWTVRKGFGLMTLCWLFQAGPLVNCLRKWHSKMTLWPTGETTSHVFTIQQLLRGQRVFSLVKVSRYPERSERRQRPEAAQTVASTPGCF